MGFKFAQPAMFTTQKYLLPNTIYQESCNGLKQQVLREVTTAKAEELLLMEMETCFSLAFIEAGFPLRTNIEFN
jgi:hypothetical protein